MEEIKNIYFFTLGTNHSLSKIDIVNTLQKKGADFEILEASEEVLVIEMGEFFDFAQGRFVQNLIDELGSAAKIGRIFKVFEGSSWSVEALKGEIAGEKLGISVYNAGGKLRQVDKLFRETRKLGNVKEGGRVLSTVTVDKKGLLTSGLELIICVGRQGVYVGKTLAIQDYEGYSLRDYGRPARDPKSGMIPPKLAKMMVNLALADKDKVLLDPFCGSGTILQEMALLGFEKIIGSDSSRKSIEDTRTNLDWLWGRFGLERRSYDIKLMQADVAKLSSEINFKTVGAIVTEPYLGSARAKYFKEAEIKKEIDKLQRLYLSAFDEFRKVLKDNGVIVIIFPVFRLGSRFFHLDILEKVSALGFRKRKFIPNLPVGGEELNLNLTSRGSIIFFRPGQTVSREIFVLERR